MPQRILIVDDEPEIRRLVASYLIEDAFHVEELGDGRAALERLQRRPAIDLVVLDVRMPELDGIDTLRELRRFSDVHVIMLTAAADETDRLIGFSVGADDYVTKPFSPREVVAKGPRGIALVTDAVAAMQQPAGTCEFAGREIISHETGVRYADGTLAGSALTMDAAVRLLVAFTRCDTRHALTSATHTPTDLPGDRTRGRIEVGARADLVLLDEDLDVAATISGGDVADVSDRALGRIPEHLRRVEPAWKS